MVFTLNTKSSEGYTNYEGGEAYPMSLEMELYTAVVTSSLSPTTYERPQARVARISQLVSLCDPYFVAQLAIYARTVMNLRSIPLLLVVELAFTHKGDDLVSRTVAKVVQRADEITELLSCYAWRNGRGDSWKNLSSISKQIQKGLQMAFDNFDEYQFGKYKNATKYISLRDALNMVHPKAADSQQEEIFGKIASDTLATPYTWETELSALGKQTFETEEQKNLAFADKWTELVFSGRLGYMALLRNLRNLLDYKVSDSTIEKACSIIANPAAIAKARQLPIRYMSAYSAINRIWYGHNKFDVYGANPEHIKRLNNALEEAVKHTAYHIAGFDENTRIVIATDTSGSMFSTLSKDSSVYLYNVGFLLSMLLKHRCKNVITGMFGDTWAEMELPSSDILENTLVLECYAGMVGYSTNGYEVLNSLYNKRTVVDKVMMFTDLQMWDSKCRKNTLQKSWNMYKQIAPEAKLYLFDLAGYGQASISMAEKDVYLLAGWSDKVFDVLEALDNGSNAIEEIKKIKI